MDVTTIPSKLRTRSKAWVAGAFLILAVLACTSNDTLFIKLTPAPTPTIAPTALPVDTVTSYKVGDSVYALSSKQQVELSDRPGEKSLSSSGTFANCFRNEKVTITEVARSVVQSDDPFFYYKIKCKDAQGWVAEYDLTLFNPSNGKAVIKSPDGKGAVLYQKADQTSKPVQDAPCEDGTQVTITGMSRILNIGAKAEDPTKYARVKCGSVTGYVLENLLAPAAS
jgi:hypothetical protein